MFINKNNYMPAICSMHSIVEKYIRENEKNKISHGKEVRSGAKWSTLFQSRNILFCFERPAKLSK